MVAVVQGLQLYKYSWESGPSERGKGATKSTTLDFDVEEQCLMRKGFLSVLQNASAVV